jgi:hypothetical protein
MTVMLTMGMASCANLDKSEDSPVCKGLSLETAPKLVQELAERGLWLEQEPISIDSRLKSALEVLDP